MIDLKFRRMNAGLRQLDLAEKTGVPAAYITQIERGDRIGPTEHLRKLAEFFGLSDPRLLLRHVVDPVYGSTAINE